MNHHLGLDYIHKYLALNGNLQLKSLVFFEVTELNFLTIKFKEENELGQCPTYSEDEKILIHFPL
jgi:hypothetical protein